MKHRKVPHWSVVIIFLCVTIIWSGTSDSQAQDDRSLHWDRFDVTIDNFDTAANTFDVTESYQITVERGPFTYGFAEIPHARLDQLSNFKVFDNGVQLGLGCTQARGTVCIRNDGENFTIQYYFTDTLQSGTRDIRLEYTVHGALRSYDDGDELFWAALPEALAFPVGASRVQVILNPDMTSLAVTSYPDTWNYFAEGNVLTWDSPSRPSDYGMFEVRVKYPHNPAMDAPEWQARYDRENVLRIMIRFLLGVLLGGTGF